ncbi:MAG: hypothetical protein KJ077_02585 [Anaerolineae bacterium]|nr:hypothetical protein [Anaerolineae bacterium]
MDNLNVATALLQLTGNLSPVAGSTKRQLSQLRKDLIDVLQSQSLPEILAPGSRNLQAIFSSEPFITKNAINSIDEIVSKIQPVPERETLPSDIKVFRREVPLITSQHSSSVPKWAAGQKISYTLGPFTDNFGKLFWFDFYHIKRQIKVARGNAGAIFLTIPVKGFLSVSNTYSLDKGSIWFVSNHLSASAPAGAYTGLSIKKGKLRIDGAVSISGDTILIGNNDSCKLELELDQPSDAPALDTNTGDDAKQMDITLPGKVNLVCNPGAITLTQSDPMALKIYGDEYKFTYASQASQFDSVINRILVPFNPNVNRVTITNVQSQLFQPEQAALIKLSAWALPVTLTGNINQLGEASGSGAICFITDEGLLATWKGFEKGPAKLKKCYLMAEPGRIALTATQAFVRDGRQQFELWEENNPTKKIRAQANLNYPKQFTVLYNSLSNGNETVMLMELKSNFTVDRPLRADSQRLKIHTDKTELVLIEIKSVKYVFIQAKDVLQRLIANKLLEELHPIAFALSNALIKTTPVDDLYLTGILENEKKINKGAVAIVCHIYNLIPSLPDPYVSSYKIAFSGDYYRERVSSTTGYGGYKSASGVSLLSFIQWPVPDKPLTTFAFVETNPGDLQVAMSLPERPAHQNIDVLSSGEVTYPKDQGTAAQNPQTFLPYRIKISQVQEVTEEDETNSQNLRSYFDDVLHTSQEQIYMLDVSTNADLLGVGLNIFGRRDDHNREALAASSSKFPFIVVGVDLSTFAANTKLYTLPQIQWEPIRTIQNPEVKPYPFPSPATSPDTGAPTIIGTEVYDLVPIAPRAVVNKIITAYNHKTNPAKVAGLFTLPFGMKVVALWDNAFDNSKQGASISLNQPKFEKDKVEGGIQISVLATSPDIGDDFETAGFKGATIQTRNLIELLTGNIPLDDEGKPLSVLGPVVDTIFNNEFKPGGANQRVPVHRIDFSGYGATLFSNWLNPNAAIAATSQARFDVWIGRTSHEIIQVKSILYPWGVPVVRTITIQRTSGAGVTRYDSGWKAQGPGVYDFSYYVVTNGTKTKVPNPFEFHPGVVKGVYNVTGIKDTGRIYRQPGAVPADDVIMQEVFFDTDVLIEDVKLGASNGFVPSKKQRGFVQLAPYQKPLTAKQFYDLLQEEGGLGGPLDCVVDVGLSGQPMRIVRVDVSGVDNSGSHLFASTGHGSLQLPKEGSWSLVKRKENTKDIVSINENAGLPLIREGKLNTIPTQPYRFADPVDILQASTPASDYGILHSTGSEKVLYLRPTIQRNDANIKSTLRPYFADSFAILGSVAIFPNLDTTFQLGATGTNLEIKGPGLLKLTSGGNFKAPVGYTRDLLNNGGSRIYVDYSDVAGSGDTTDVSYLFDSQAPVPWQANLKKQSIVIDLLAFKSLITVTTEFDAAAGKRPEMTKPKTKFGSILQPIVDFLSFLGDFDMSQALAVSMGNATTQSWQPKFQGILDIEIEFETFPPPAKPELTIKVAHIKVSGPEEGEEVSPLPVLILGCEISLKAYFNTLPYSLSTDEPSTDIEVAKKEMISSGATLEIEGAIHILCFTITPNVAGVYFVGIIGFEFGIDDKEGKSFGFKAALGLELRAKWPVVGEVAVMMALGVEVEISDAGSGVFAIMIFKGEAELLGGIIIIGIAIEAKGGQEKESSGETFAVCEVEFAVEVSLAFVIHFEFDVTWQETKQIS